MTEPMTPEPDPRDFSQSTPIITGDEVQHCPECQAGKHANCPGWSWSDAEDARVPCPCHDRGSADHG